MHVKRGRTCNQRKAGKYATTVQDGKTRGFNFVLDCSRHKCLAIELKHSAPHTSSGVNAQNDFDQEIINSCLDTPSNKTLSKDHTISISILYLFSFFFFFFSFFLRWLTIYFSFSSYLPKTKTQTKVGHRNSTFHKSLIERKRLNWDFFRRSNGSLRLPEISL